VTGHALEEDVQAFLAAGANAVYSKPMSRHMIAQAIAKHVTVRP
jgi:CheY-like chemotaxis protein